MNREFSATAVTEAKSASADLSNEIILMLDKQPADRVTCRRIFGDSYRCNWWAPTRTAAYDNPGMDGLTVTTHRVRQSRIVTATKTAEGIIVSNGVRRSGTMAEPSGAER